MENAVSSILEVKPHYVRIYPSLLHLFSEFSFNRSFVKHSTVWKCNNKWSTALQVIKQCFGPKTTISYFINERSNYRKLSLVPASLWFLLFFFICF